MALSQAERDALPAHLFAVPEKRKLPIPDAEHVKMAWNMVGYTKELTDAERDEARRNILERAEKLGMDTSGWDKSAVKSQLGASMRFEAMALDIPDVPDHPNRVPFSGVLTRVDEPSDNPVGGANGKRVLIPADIAEAAIPSLLGMAVDYRADLAGHDPKNKIGIITSAVVEGKEIHISGFLYGSDFPKVVAEIQRQKSKLGFSYEAQASVANWNHDPVEVTSCTFTGAAILLKDKAAYTSTSLTAHAEPENDMELKEVLAEMAALKAQSAAMAATLEELKTNSASLSAASVLGKVKPHTDALRAVADGMEKDGIGMHDKRGHVAHLRRMADKMDAEAVMGKLPHIFGDESWIEASAENQEVTALAAEVKTLKEQLFAQAKQPERQTDSGTPPTATKPALVQASGQIDTRAKDAELKASGASIQQRLAAITESRMTATR